MVCCCHIWSFGNGSHFDGFQCCYHQKLWIPKLILSVCTKSGDALIASILWSCRLGSIILGVYRCHDVHVSILNQHTQFTLPHHTIGNHISNNNSLNLNVSTSMMYFTSIITLAAAFFCLTKALPTRDPDSGNTSLQALTPRMECLGGTNFYICSNNKFNGCCSVDPCALPACPDYPSNYVYPHIIGNPEHYGTADQKLLELIPPQARCMPGDNKMYQRTMHTIFPGKQSAAGASGNAISLSRNADPQSEKQQLIEFPSLPDGAHSCALHWSRNSSFSVAGSGLVELFAVSSVPSPVNYEMVMSMRQGKVGIIDFGIDFEKTDHEIHWDGEPSGCKDMRLFKVGFPEGRVGSVELAQNEGSGFYIDYYC